MSPKLEVNQGWLFGQNRANEAIPVGPERVAKTVVERFDHHLGELRAVTMVGIEHRLGGMKGGGHRDSFGGRTEGRHDGEMGLTDKENGERDEGL